MATVAETPRKGRSLPQNVLYMLRMIWGFDKTLFLLLAVESLCKVAMPFFGIYLPKLAVDTVTAGAPLGEAAMKIGLLTAGMIAAYSLGNFADKGKYMRYNTLRAALMSDIFLTSLQCDYAYLESPEGQAHYNYAISTLQNGDGSATSRMIPALAGFVMGLLGFGAYSGVLVTLHPLVVALLVLSSIAVYATMRRAVRYERSRNRDMGAAFQKTSYMQKVGEDTAYGKDVRLYGLNGLIVAAREKALEGLMNLRRDIERRELTTGAVDAAITLVRDGAAYIYLIAQVVSGGMTAGDFVFYFGAIAGFSAWLTTLFREFNTINSTHFDIGRIRDFLELRTADDPERPAPAPDLAEPHSIEFDDVTFAYGKDEPPALDHFSMRIAAGEKVALVGVNGAGKTTIVKLLCGFYRPDSGRILLGDVDIREFRRKDLYALFSAVFQDIMILPYTVMENVALQAVGKVDRKKAEDCLRRANLWDEIAARKGGLEANLTRTTEADGFYLSGGQQQRLMLARALYKDAPILVLDEPTAALDPIAESRLYEQYHELARRKTSLFISHRLASTRFCDRVVFLSGGRAAETGTHEELMAAGKGYAHMFEIQSHYYKENIGEEVAPA